MLTGKTLGAAIESARLKKKVSKKDMADHFGVRPPSIQDWVNKGTISKDRLPDLWRFFADVVGPDHWGLDPDTDFTAAPANSAREQAHPLSLSPYTIPSQILWEDVKAMQPSEIPKVFILAIPDEALAGKYELGFKVVFDRDAAPRVGKPMLVEDRTGERHVRIYGNVRGDRWQAIATNVGHLTLDSMEDGLTVLAAGVLGDL